MNIKQQQINRTPKMYVRKPIRQFSLSWFSPMFSISIGTVFPIWSCHSRRISLSRPFKRRKQHDNMTMSLSTIQSNSVTHGVTLEWTAFAYSYSICVMTRWPKGRLRRCWTLCSKMTLFLYSPINPHALTYNDHRRAPKCVYRVCYAWVFRRIALAHAPSKKA